IKIAIDAATDATIDHAADTASPAPSTAIVATNARAADLHVVAAQGNPGVEKLAGALAWNRDHLACRAAVVARNPAELTSRLGGLAASPADEIAGVVRGVARAQKRIAFVFPGQGGQWIGMGRALFAQSPTFADAIRRCAAALAPHVEWDLVACIAEDGVAG